MDYYPKFYYTSSCLAGDCPDTCCAGWEIPLTKKDEEILQRCSSDGQIPDDITATDEDGDACMRLDNGKCPLLNADGLCDLRLKYSQSETPEVCRQHPLFIEEYDGFTEKCPSLSCPAVCREVFASDLKDKIYPTPKYRGDDSFLALLIKTREMISEKVNTERIGLLEAIDGTINLALCVDQLFCFDEDFCDADFDCSECFSTRPDLSDGVSEHVDGYISMLKDRCEILGEKWERMLEKASETHFDFSKIQAVNRNKEYLLFFMYLVYRYWLKGINTDSALEYAMFIVFGTMACAHISLVADVPFGETARMYSKEIEHDTDNIEEALEFIDEILADCNF